MAKQTVELPLIWDTITLMWRHYNISILTRTLSKQAII